MNIPSTFLWITDAKEIENYIPGNVWSAVYVKNSVPNPDEFDAYPDDCKTGSFVTKHLNRNSFNKCEFAMEAVPHLTREALADRFEFESKICSLIVRIRDWNK